MEIDYIYLDDEGNPDSEWFKLTDDFSKYYMSWYDVDTKQEKYELIEKYEEIDDKLTEYVCHKIIPRIIKNVFNKYLWNMATEAMFVEMENSIINELQCKLPNIYIKSHKVWNRNIFEYYKNFVEKYSNQYNIIDDGSNHFNYDNNSYILSSRWLCKQLEYIL